MGSRPGLNPKRLIRLGKEAVSKCRINLSGKVVLTEAAAGAYVITPVLAALAGAEEVVAITRSSRYGTVEEVRDQTMNLARLAGVNKRIRIATEKSQDIFAQADIVTNSGHLRPLDAQTISWMKPTAVIPLMYEAWELRASDVDLEACRRRGIRFSGTNERHPAIGVFTYLGTMALKLLLDAGLEVQGNRILLVCDNAFGPFLEAGLSEAGVRVEKADSFQGIEQKKACDAVLVALRPHSRPVLGPDEACQIARHCPDAAVLQFWGDIERGGLAAAGLSYWPEEAPAAGHMGVLPSDIGPAPVVRLQAGGWKVGEILSRSRGNISELDQEFLDEI